MPKNWAPIAPVEHLVSEYGKRFGLSSLSNDLNVEDLDLKLEAALKKGQPDPDLAPIPGEDIHNN